MQLVRWLSVGGRIFGGPMKVSIEGVSTLVHPCRLLAGPLQTRCSAEKALGAPKCLPPTNWTGSRQLRRKPRRLRSGWSISKGSSQSPWMNWRIAAALRRQTDKVRRPKHVLHKLGGRVSTAVGKNFKLPSVTGTVQACNKAMQAPD